MTSLARLEQLKDSRYAGTRQLFNPEIMYDYLHALNTGSYGDIPKSEILAEATRFEAFENTTPASKIKKLIPSLKLEYMRHVFFRRFQEHLMNEEQTKAANNAIEHIACQLKWENQAVPTYEECLEWGKAQTLKANQEREEMLNFMAPPKLKRQHAQYTEVSNEDAKDAPLRLPPAATASLSTNDLEPALKRPREADTPEAAPSQTMSDLHPASPPPPQ